MSLGICLGIIGALFQSISYLFSRLCLQKTKMTALRFLMVSHATMALFALIALCYTGIEFPADNSWVGWMFLGSTSYMAGQLCLIKALSKSDPSRVSSLLGLKVPMLAVFSFLIMGDNYGWMQWLAIILIIATAVVLASAGGKISKKGIMWIILATSGYCLSDVGATNLVRSFDMGSQFHTSLFAVCLSYICCSLYTLIYFLFKGLPKVDEMRATLPYSSTWFLSFIFLFASFSSVGFVIGNIAQSSRGIISIVLGLMVASLGFRHLEEKISRKQFMHRLAAGMVMLSAIGIFSMQ